MAKKAGLGNKFASIFDDDVGVMDSPETGGIVTLNINDLEPNKEQPRKEFDPEDRKSVV